MIPKVSIIIVNYGKDYFVQKCLESISKSSHSNLQVIVIDNNKKNLGFAGACNLGAKKAKGEYLFFLNNDIMLDKETISLLVKKLQSNQKIAIAGCTVKNYQGEKILHANLSVDIFGFPVTGNKSFYIEGSAIMIKKEVFEKLFFDAQYFMFHEDIDLAWRAKLLGYRVCFLNETCVYHWGGLTAGGNPSERNKYKTTYPRRFYSEKNNLTTLLKNYGLLTLIFILPFYLLINLVEILFFLILGDTKAVICYLKSYHWNIIHLKTTLKKRKKIQQQRLISDVQIIKTMFWGSGKLLSFIKVGIPKFS